MVKKERKFSVKTAGKTPPFPDAIWDDSAGWLERLVQCAKQNPYDANPFELPRSGEPFPTQGTVFIQTKLYPMPPGVPNPLTWVQRCDLIYADFKKECGPIKQEGDFWAEVLRWLPHLKAFPKTTTEGYITEKDDGLTRKKTKFQWDLETYYIRLLGYNGNPPNPWGKGTHTPPHIA